MKKLLFITYILIAASCAEARSAPLNTNLNLKSRLSQKSDTATLNRYIRQAFSYTGKPQYTDLLKSNIDSAESFCVKHNMGLPASLHLARAEYFFITGDYNNSFQEADVTLRLADETGDHLVHANALLLLGKYYLRTGFFKESIDQYNSALNLSSQKKLKGISGRAYNGKADAYNYLGDIKNYRLTLGDLVQSSYRSKDTFNIKNGLFRLGSSYCDKERNFRKADSLLKICLSVSLITKDTVFSGLALANIGWNYYNEKMFPQAIEAYNNSLRYSIPSRRYINAANAYGNLGTIFRDMGKTDRAISNYHRAIEQAKKLDDVYTLYWVYEDMSEMYLRQKDTANAYKNYVLFKKYNDAFITKSNVQGLSEAKIRYDADTHNKELQLLSLKLSNQKILIYAYTGLIILSLAIGVLIYSRSRINAKRKLSEMNSKIAEITQANLRQQMNPHFIFNTLNSIQYYMYQHDKIATNNYLTKFSSLMRRVLENSQHTSVLLRDELEALNLYLELEKIRFKDKFDFEIKVDDEIDTLIYKVPAMLIQPYVENSLIHGLMPSGVPGIVRISLKLQNDYIACVIEDNGIGREAAADIKRKREDNHNSLATHIITSRLDLVNTLYGTSLKTVYTDLKNVKGEPTGTRVEIQIPILT